MAYPLVIAGIAACTVTIGVGIYCYSKKSASKHKYFILHLCHQNKPIYYIQALFLSYIRSNLKYIEIAEALFPLNSLKHNKSRSTFHSKAIGERRPLLSPTDVTSSRHYSTSPVSSTLNISPIYTTWLESVNTTTILREVGIPVYYSKNTTKIDMQNSSEHTISTLTPSPDEPVTISYDDHHTTASLALKTLEISSISPEKTNNFNTVFGIVCSSYEREKQMANLESILVAESKIAYDSSNPQHEQLLIELWNKCTENDILGSRKSDQWKSIGFQGKDPATDFRSMGILGLNNLLQFVHRHPQHAKEIIQYGRDEDIKWFPFAISGINLTLTCLDLLRNRHVDTFFLRYGVSRTTFDDLYALIFLRLQNHWKAHRPENMMQFNVVLQKLLEQIKIDAKNDELIRYYA